MQDYCVLQQEELVILASAFEIKQIYGIVFQEREEEARVPYHIHEMARNGILKFQNETLIVTDFYREIFQTIADAEKILTVRKYVKDEDYSWYYIGSKVVCLQESREDVKAVRISICTKEDFYKTLEESGFLPETFIDPELAALEPLEEVQAKLSEFLVCFRYRTAFIAESRGNEEREYCLVRSKHNYWILENTRQDQRLIRYEQKKFYELLMDEREEEIIL